MNNAELRKRQRRCRKEAKKHLREAAEQYGYGICKWCRKLLVSGGAFPELLLADECSDCRRSQGKGVLVARTNRDDDLADVRRQFYSKSSFRERLDTKDKSGPVRVLRMVK